MKNISNENINFLFFQNPFISNDNYSVSKHAVKIKDHSTFHGYFHINLIKSFVHIKAFKRSFLVNARVIKVISYDN